MKAMKESYWQFCYAAVIVAAVAAFAWANFPKSKPQSDSNLAFYEPTWADEHFPEGPEILESLSDIEDRLSGIELKLEDLSLSDSFHQIKLGDVENKVDDLESELEDLVRIIKRQSSHSNANLFSL